MRFLYTWIPLILAATSFADTLTLRSGQQVQGTYIGGSARQIKMAVGDQIQAFDVVDVASLVFNGNNGGGEALAAPLAAAPAAPPPQAAPAPPPAQGPTQTAMVRPDPNAPPQTADPGSMGVEIPAGTNLVVRMIDAVDSRKNTVGQTFNASMDEPLILNGNTVIPRGADVVVKLVDDKESGKLAGKTILTLDLVSVRVNGKMVDINTQTYSQASSSRTSRTAKMAGGGAALGAIIGAIAGGGKGAAIGAGAGAATGAGAEVLTKGQQVRIPSETRLTFVVDTPVKI
jgi:hypothetical protein